MVSNGSLIELPTMALLCICTYISTHNTIIIIVLICNNNPFDHYIGTHSYLGETETIVEFVLYLGQVIICMTHFTGIKD